MMHDFGVSPTHTVIMDLPLSLDPRNLAKGLPALSYDPSSCSRFGIFTRHNPSAVKWFKTNACCIFHTANTWDTTTVNQTTKIHEVTAVNMLACRLTSATLVYNAGDIAAPIPQPNKAPVFPVEEEQCRLYYYQFSLAENMITHQWALATIAIEFPTIRESVSMTSARYVYGCTVSHGTFGAALGRAAKIDSLVKVDVDSLIARGVENPPSPIIGCVDTRSVSEIMVSEDPVDPIKIFRLPPGFYAQESQFVPRCNGDSEDDGWILFYVFDESQLDPNGEARHGAKSQLWIVDAKSMKEVVCKVQLPQRVPYGLHGKWFNEEDILGQRPFERLRQLPNTKMMTDGDEEGLCMKIWLEIRESLIDMVG